MCELNMPKTAAWIWKICTGSCQPKIGNMFRASPWISYEPQSGSQPHQTHSHDSSTSPPDANMQPGDMDAPEISILREEETPPPDAGGLSFSRFRVNLRVPTQGLAAPPGSSIGPPVGPIEDPGGAA